MKAKRAAGGDQRAAGARSAAGQALAQVVEQDLLAAQRQLVYVDDSGPGYRRVKRGNGYAYLDTHGRKITDEAELRRIRSLAIPPAYEQVWICPLPDGHIQATARDARGRKQYRYHPLWQARRDATKFERLREFGLALPRIRRAVARDLERPGLPAEKVLATIVRLLDTTYLRVGNDEYARENGSYGLTTLRNRHAAVHGSTLKLSFRGKSGVHQRVQLQDPKVARIVRKLQELPGQELFQWLGDDGSTPHSVGSADVNDYLRRIAGGDFTAKDFRTWHASALALESLHACDAASGGSQQQRVKEVIAGVAQRLGHTLAVCRKSYVHPQVLQSFVEGTLHDACARAGNSAGSLRGLKDGERQLLALLKPTQRSRRLDQAAVAPAAPPPGGVSGRSPSRTAARPPATAKKAGPRLRSSARTAAPTTG